MTAIDERVVNAPASVGHALTTAAHIQDRIPAGINIVSWNISASRIKGQMQVWPANAATSRANIRTLAEHFGLTYRETENATYTAVEAVGEYAGLRVSLWDHVDPSTCQCGCHKAVTA